MADFRQLKIIRKGASEWNAWRRDNDSILPDLGGADLREAHLRGANLSDANLSDADLRAADLSGADLSGADLSRATMCGANLRGTDVAGADLLMANLTGAELIRTNLSGACLSRAYLGGVDLSTAYLGGADLSGANLENASFLETVFANTYLKDTEGLESCKHAGPSTLDFRTLARSGQLALSFLRGCGLPDVLIDYLPSLLNEPIQFYSCFISYSTLDQGFADRLHADLQNKGVRCWFAPHDIQGGKKVHEQIDEAIRVYDRLLLVLSESSMQSNWVEREIVGAFKKQREHKKNVLFPIGLANFGAIQGWECFDSDTGRDLARDIRSYFIPDFSRWKDHDQYQHAFERLVRDLKNET